MWNDIQMNTNRTLLILLCTRGGLAAKHSSQTTNFSSILSSWSSSMQCSCCATPNDILDSIYWTVNKHDRFIHILFRLPLCWFVTRRQWYRFDIYTVRFVSLIVSLIFDYCKWCPAVVFCLFILWYCFDAIKVNLIFHIFCES